MIQSLPLTLGISNDTWIVLDGLRKKRNQSDYTGAPAAQSEVSEALDQATALLSAVRVYINKKRPDLLG